MTEQDVEPDIPGVTFAVSLDELEALDINAALNELSSIDCSDLSLRFAQLIGERPDAQSPALRLLKGICDYGTDPDNAGEPFKPMLAWEDRRTLVPSDLCEAQVGVIAEFALAIKNVGLRARLADVAWTIQRKRQDAADLAVHAYCEGIEALRVGSVSLAFENGSAWCFRAKGMAVRAARISSIIGWRRSSAERTKSLIADLVRQAASEDRGDDFCRLAEVDLKHRLTSEKTVADEAERMVGLEKYTTDPCMRKWLLEIAVRAFQLVSDDNGRHRCIRGIARCLEQMAEMTNSAIFKSSYLEEAFGILRHANNAQDEREAIKEKLREVQPNIPDEMHSFSMASDFSELADAEISKLSDAAISKVSGQIFPTALLQLFSCGQFPRETDFGQETEQKLSIHQLKAMSPLRTRDSQGRVTFKSFGMDDEDKKRRFMNSDRRETREIIVSGIINPTRETLAKEHQISVDVIDAMLQESALVPRGHRRIFARGIAAFIRGENIDAASILVPQLENTLRHALSLNGIDCTSMNDKDLQNEATLSLLLNRKKPWRSELEQVFPDGHIDEIDSLFSFGGGTVVRHQIAHGKLTDDNFWDVDVTYACWLIMQLIALPMSKRWSEVEKTYYRASGESAPVETGSLDRVSRGGNGALS